MRDSNNRNYSSRRSQNGREEDRTRSSRRRKIKKKSPKVLPVFIALVIIFGGGYLLFDKVVLDYITKPEIKLNGEPVETINVFSEFVDPGVSVTVRGETPQNDVIVEGSVDTQVVGEYTIVYKATNDKGKRTKEVERKVIVADTEPPIIELNGKDPITVYIGSTYKEKGASASDNYDGDLTASITIEGTVKTDKLNDFNLVYHVKDSSGNEAEIKRTVRVRENPPPSSTIFLSFDDGPSKITEEILDTLKKNNAKATFFVIGSELDKYADIVKRAHDEGHTIGLHSNSHKYEKIYASDEAFWDDINTLSDRVEKITGEKSRILRFPGGASNTISKEYSKGIMTRLVTQAHDKGYQIYDWTIDSFDASANIVPESTISSRVIDGMSWDESPALVLMHDAKIKQSTADALQKILTWGKKNGYTFAPMDLNTPEYLQKIGN